MKTKKLGRPFLSDASMIKKNYCFRLSDETAAILMFIGDGSKQKAFELVLKEYLKNTQGAIDVENIAG